MDGKENTFEASPLSLSSPFPSSVNERANGAHRSVRCDGAGPATLITTALHLRSLCGTKELGEGGRGGRETRSLGCANRHHSSRRCEEMLRRDMNGHCTRLTPNWGRVGVVGKQALPPNNWCSSLAGHGSGSEVPLWNPLCHAFCAQSSSRRRRQRGGRSRRT